MAQAQPLDIIIVERMGGLKQHTVKDFKFEELYKKCGFKKGDGFNKQSEWNVKLQGTKYVVQVYAKDDGRANTENKYDFPPPIDTKLFYGSCAIVGQIKRENGSLMLTNMSVEIWNKIYEKLFGGFEDLSKTAKEDEEEIDELEFVPKEKKTKQGYLKDGFVVDSSDTEETTPDSSEVADEDVDVEESGDTEESSNELVLEDVGSELSEESYDYDDDDVAK